MICPLPHPKHPSSFHHRGVRLECNPPMCSCNDSLDGDSGRGTHCRRICWSPGTNSLQDMVCKQSSCQLHNLGTCADEPVLPYRLNVSIHSLHGVREAHFQREEWWDPTRSSTYPVVLFSCVLRMHASRIQFDRDSYGMQDRQIERPSTTVQGGWASLSPRALGHPLRLVCGRSAFRRDGCIA